MIFRLGMEFCLISVRSCLRGLQWEVVWRVRLGLSLLESQVEWKVSHLRMWIVEVRWEVRLELSQARLEVRWEVRLEEAAC